MFRAWILLLFLLLGARAFVIHTQHSLCLEESAATSEVTLKKCNLDSAAQQWIWTDQGMLMCVSSSRCLSALERERVQTQSCWVPEVDVTGLMWDCDRGRLINRNTSMLLSTDGWHLILTHDSKQSKWSSLDVVDICQKKIRSRRVSDDPESEAFEAAEEQTSNVAAMTDEQREYLRWYYRTEDTTTWKFALLGLAFICLLVGFLLLGMGAMANKSRKKIAKYRAAAAVALKFEELQIISPPRDDSSIKPSPSPSLNRLMQGDSPSPHNGEATELKAGNIVVTWKDGNTSCLYSDPTAEEESADVAVKKME